MVVGSLAALLPVLSSPPPDTVTLLVTEAGALLATSTKRVSGGYLVPAASGVLPPNRLQGPAGGVQLQPLPLIDVAVRPAGGSVSVTVTVLPD